jgi:hypothetical protein
MKSTHALTVLASIALGASAFATSQPTVKNNLNSLDVAYSLGRDIPVVGAAADFIRPRVGVRAGVGEWKELVANFGVDVTFHVPIIPLPAIRFDGEVWGKPSNFGKDRRGNAISVLGIQSVAFGYAGIGPSYYFSDNNGDRKSGIGAKVLAGFSLPHSLYAEVEALIGPSPVPIFATIGTRF